MSVGGIENALAAIRLFRMQSGTIRELPAESIAIEKSLQSMLEANLEAFLGVRFLASEYVTGKRHGGRIDTLGLDDNNCPVIIEYKRAMNENVINQGLFYLDWLMDHQGEFTLAVIQQLGSEFKEKIDWSGTRLLCIAGDFTRYDEYAVMQIPRNVELLRYRRYGTDLLLLELVNSGSAEAENKQPKSAKVQHFADQVVSGTPASGTTQELFESLKAYLLALGDDVTMKSLEHYTAFRRIKNFACVKILGNELQVWVKVDPATIQLREGFTRDVTRLGHLGTGNLEIRLQNASDLEEAKPLLMRSYRES